jgi:hypothetical protein
MTEAKRNGNPEMGEKDRRVGCLLKDLDDKLFQDIVDIYDRILGGHGKKYSYGVEEVYQMLRRSNIAEFRFGSFFTQDSKLEITREFSDDPKAQGHIVVGVNFYENTSVRREDKPKIEELNGLFQQSIKNLFTERGIAIPLI